MTSLPALIRHAFRHHPILLVSAGIGLALISVLLAEKLPLDAHMRGLIVGLVVVPVTVLTFRTAGRQMADTGGMSVGWLLYFACLALPLFAAGRVIGIYLPPPPPIPWQPPPPKVTVEDGHILVAGPIDYRTLTELRGIIEGGGAPALVVLQSDGGHSIAGRSIGILIAKTGLDTRVEGNCYSACAMAFAGGHRRSLGPDGRLGFHRPGVDHKDRVVTLDPAKVADKDRAFLLDRGITPEFADQILSTPPDELWLPSRLRMTAGGMLTDDP